MQSGDTVGDSYKDFAASGSTWAASQHGASSDQGCRFKVHSKPAHIRRMHGRQQQGRKRGAGRNEWKKGTLHDALRGLDGMDGSAALGLCGPFDSSTQPVVPLRMRSPTAIRLLLPAWIQMMTTTIYGTPVRFSEKLASRSSANPAVEHQTSRPCGRLHGTDGIPGHLYSGCTCTPAIKIKCQDPRLPVPPTFVNPNRRIMHGAISTHKEQEGHFLIGSDQVDPDESSN
ncbi:hypothetical protein PG995_007643 [Apiospora arundinis]